MKYSLAVLPGRWLAGPMVATGLLVGSAPSPAATQAVEWPTYLRAGPGPNYAVIDELDRSDALDVQGCDKGWCRVRLDGLTGYVDAEALVPPPAALSPTGKPATCFDSVQQGYPRGDTMRFCLR